MSGTETARGIERAFDRLPSFRRCRLRPRRRLAKPGTLVREALEQVNCRVAETPASGGGEKIPGERADDSARDDAPVGPFPVVDMSFNDFLLLSEELQPKQLHLGHLFLSHRISGLARRVPSYRASNRAATQSCAE
jgi:hypothetical protein